jgi:hypothetical protein
VTEWKTIPLKSDNTKKREHKRHLEDLAQVEKEVVLHGIPTLINGAPAGKKSDEARVKKILRELRPGGYEVKNGNVEGSSRQIRNTRKVGMQPITITLKSAEVANLVREAAHEVGILNVRLVQRDDVEKDRIGFLRRSLSQKERKKIKARAEFYNSDRGKSLKEIQRREAENTTDQDGWLEVNLEEADVEEENVVAEASDTEKQAALARGGQRNLQHRRQPRLAAH